MRLKILLVILLAVSLAGCATGRRLQELETKVGVLESRVGITEERQVNVDTQVIDSKESVGYLKGKVDGIASSRSTVVVAGAQSGDNRSLSAEDIQTALQKAGFYDGPIDGKIGPKTKEATKAFQEANGLKADGVVGYQTMNALMKHVQ